MCHLLALLLLLPSATLAADPEDLYTQLVAARSCTGMVCRYDIGPVNLVVVTGNPGGLPTVGVDRLDKGWRVQVVGRCVMVSQGPISESKKLGAVSSLSGAVFHVGDKGRCVDQGG